MKIAVLHRYPVSQVTGTNASFVAFLEQLDESGHEVFFLTFREDRDPRVLEFVHFIEMPWDFDRGNPRDKLLKTALWILLAPWAAWRLRRRADIELVYCDDSVPYYGFLTKLLVGRKAQVVIRMGDLQSGYSFAGQGAVKSAFFRVAIAVERFMWKVVNGTVAISAAFQEFIRGQGIDEKKITVVRESINLEAFENPVEGTLRRDLNIPPESRVVMFHGALLRCKGAESYIAAIPSIREQCPGTHFIIAGGGSEEGRLRELGRSAVEAGHLHFTGWYDHEALRGFMADVDVGVVMRSSNMANNFVVTTCLLEYWAHRKPVVVPDLAAFREVVVPEESGFFYRPDDPEDLARVIGGVLAVPERWEELGNRGYAQAERFFEYRHIAGTMVEALESYLPEGQA